MSQSPALSPEELDIFCRKNFNFSDVFMDINESLKRWSMKNDVTKEKPIKIGIKIIPNWTLEIIMKAYLDAGWASVRVSDNNGQFMTLEFFPS